MRDRLFYPILVVVIAAILALAMLPGRGDDGLTPEDLQKGYTLSGTDLQLLTAAPGTLLSFENAQDGTVSHAVLATNLPRKMAPPSAGVFGTLGPKYESFFADKTLKITVIARRSGVKPLESFQMGYFTAETGDSGWRGFNLGAEYQAYSFTFKPKKGKMNANDFVGIWPGVEGKNQTMDVQSISVQVVTLG